MYQSVHQVAVIRGLGTGSAIVPAMSVHVTLTFLTVSMRHLMVHMVMEWTKNLQNPFAPKVAQIVGWATKFVTRDVKMLIVHGIWVTVELD